MATATGAARDTYVSFRNGVTGAEFLYFLALFPLTSFVLGVNLYHASIVVLSGFVFYRLVVDDDLEVSRSFAIVLLVWTVFLLYFAISMLWSPSSTYALTKFLRLATICSLLLVAPTMLFAETERIYRFCKISIYVAVIVAATIILGFLAPNYARPYAALGVASHLGPGRIIGFGIVVTAYYVLSSERRPQLMTYGTMLGILLFGILVSESRGPLVAALVSTVTLVVLFIAVERDDKRLAALFLAASFLAVVSLFVLHFVFGVSIPNFDRILPLLRGEFDASNQRRVRFLRQGALLWLESPILGNGAGSYGVWIHGVDVEEYPHNVFVETLAELGLIGLLLFGLILAVSLRAIVANHERHPIWTLLAGLFLYALLNACFSQDLQGNRLVYATIGLALAFDTASEDGGPND